MLDDLLDLVIAVAVILVLAFIAGAREFSGI